jgi:hypothetical protein
MKLKDLRKRHRHGSRREHALQEQRAVNLDPASLVVPPRNRTCCERCVEAVMNPVRKFFGFAFLLVSWVLVVGMGIVTVDRYLDSSCGRRIVLVADITFVVFITFRSCLFRLFHYPRFQARSAATCCLCPPCSTP